HAGLMSPEQIAVFSETMKIRAGEEWDPFAGLDVPAHDLSAFLASVPFVEPAERRHHAAKIPVPPRFELPAAGPKTSTQEGFGRLLLNIARVHPSLADRHCLRSVHLPRTRCADLRLLPGRAVHSRRHAVRAGPLTRRRRSSIDCHTAHRNRSAVADRIRTGACR